MRAWRRTRFCAVLAREPTRPEGQSQMRATERPQRRSEAAIPASNEASDTTASASSRPPPRRPHAAHSALMVVLMQGRCGWRRTTSVERQLGARRSQLGRRTGTPGKSSKPGRCEVTTTRPVASAVAAMMRSWAPPGRPAVRTATSSWVGVRAMSMSRNDGFPSARSPMRPAFCARDHPTPPRPPRGVGPGSVVGRTGDRDDCYTPLS